MSSLGAGFRLFRAGWIMVREGVVAALPGDQLCRPAEIRLARRAAVHQAQGASPRPQRAACRRGHAARAVLCQARPVPGDAAGRRRQRHRARPRPAAGPHGDLPEGRGGRGDRGLARPADRRALREFRRAGRRRLDRAGASGDRRARRRDREGRRQGDPAGRAPPVPARPRKLFPRRAAAGALHPRGAPAAAGARSPRRWPRPPRSRWTCGWRRPRFPSSPRTRATIRASACRRSTGSAPAATSSPWTGSTASRCPMSRPCAPPATI